MNYLKENPNWEEKIPQIEDGFPFRGGENGEANVQSKALGNRTLHLQNQILEINEALADKITTTAVEELLKTQSPKEHNHNNATDENDGFMSKKDKIKLDNYPFAPEKMFNEFPPNYIQGFIPSCIDGQTVCFSSGQCRSEDNQGDLILRFDKYFYPFDYVGSIASNLIFYFHFYIWREMDSGDSDVNIAVLSGDPLYISNDISNVIGPGKLYRRICTLYVSQGIIWPFHALDCGRELEILYKSAVVNFTTTVAVTNKWVKLSVPPSIDCKAKILAKTNAPTTTKASIQISDSATSMPGLVLGETQYGIHTAIGDIYVPYGEVLVTATVSATTASAQIETLGYTDWRIPRWLG